MASFGTTRSSPPSTPPANKPTRYAIATDNRGQHLTSFCLLHSHAGTTQQAALEGAARRGRCDGLGGLYALLGRAWTYLGWWLGQGGEGVRHGADAHAAAGFAELNKRG